MRICARGHHNPRGVQFCAECGSADLSTPAPPASFLHHLSGAVLYLFSGLLVVILLGTALLSLFYAIDWQALSGPIVMLVLMLGVLDLDDHAAARTRQEAGQAGGPPGDQVDAEEGQKWTLVGDRSISKSGRPDEPESTVRPGRAARGSARGSTRGDSDDRLEATDRLWDIRDVSQYLHVPVSSIYKMTARQAAVRIPHIHIGGKLRFRRSDVDRWLTLLTTSNIETLARMREAVSR